VLDCEIDKNPDKELLAAVVNLCLNSESLSQDDLKRASAFVEGAEKTGLDRSDIITGIAALTGITVAELLLGPAAGLSIAKTAGSAWLERIINKKALKIEQR
jgi:hypothetical protein